MRRSPRTARCPPRLRSTAVHGSSAGSRVQALRGARGGQCLDPGDEPAIQREPGTRLRYDVGTCRGSRERLDDSGQIGERSLQIRERSVRLSLDAIRLGIETRGHGGVQAADASTEGRRKQGQWEFGTMPCDGELVQEDGLRIDRDALEGGPGVQVPFTGDVRLERRFLEPEDRKSTRLNSSHLGISYAVFCLKTKKREAWRATEPSNSV